MIKTILAALFTFIPVAAYAHSADMSLIIHAVEHGWMVLALLPLLLLLLPLGRARRR